MTQWFFKITEYAEELLKGLKTLDWPEKTKKIQENWIEKSTGCEIVFQSEGEDVRVFTTRPDTVMGVTYLVLAPEHPLVDRLTVPERKDTVLAYTASAAKRTEVERASAAKEKTGVFLGAYAVHPISGKRIPIWVSDYVLMSYGAGAVMAVPAHDERDYMFARRYHLPILPVIGNGVTPQTLPFCGEGVLINSGPYDGLTSEEARRQIASVLEKTGRGKPCVQCKLRDWLVSRQRYWGAPIPIVYCDSCGIVPVPEKDLPVKLPYDVAFQPNGSSPLATCGEFVNTVCPKCGKPAKRETDTLDTFVCSSWYYLRFYDNKDASQAFSKERVNQLLPVDKYVGGVEHASMHLLYARFITKALRDMGYLSFDEPFASVFHQGTILGSDGQKMSKRSGAVPPDEYIRQYGSDVFRMYLGFGFSYRDGGQWNDGGMKAIERFVLRVCRIIGNFLHDEAERSADYRVNDELEYVRNQTIRQVTEDMDEFRFNTAIARIMEYVGVIVSYQAGSFRSRPFEESAIKDLILLLAPLAPHLAEELWEHMGYAFSVHNQPYPKFEEKKRTRKEIEIAVQVNGSLRDVISVPCGIDGEAIKQLAANRPKIKATIKGRDIRKVIIVKDRLINFVL